MNTRATIRESERVGPGQAEKGNRGEKTYRRETQDGCEVLTETTEVRRRRPLEEEWREESDEKEVV